MSCYIPVLEKLKNLRKEATSATRPGNTNQGMTMQNRADPIILKQSHFSPDNQEPKMAKESGVHSGARQVRRRDPGGVTITQQLGQFPHKVPLNIRHNHPTLGLGDVAFQREHLDCQTLRALDDSSRNTGGVLTLGLPSHWRRKPFRKEGSPYELQHPNTGQPMQRVFHTASSDIIKQTYTHNYETLRPHQDMKVSRKLTSSLPRRLRKHGKPNERPRSVQGRPIKDEQKEPRYANQDITRPGKLPCNRSSEDDEGLGAEVTSKSNAGDSFTSSSSHSVTPGPRSSPGAPLDQETPPQRNALVNHQGMPPNQGPPPRHLLPKTLKPSPGYKLHPALPASALIASLEPQYVNQPSSTSTPKHSSSSQGKPTKSKIGYKNHYRKSKMLRADFYSSSAWQKYAML